MPSQARAEETRQRILDAATGLFGKYGFGGTSVNQIIRRAGVTAGAFYHHFDSKDQVALTIVEQVGQQMASLRVDFVGSPEAGLDNVIDMTFRLGALLDDQGPYRVAAFLEHTVARHTRQGSQDVGTRVGAFVADLTQAVLASDLRNGVDPGTAAKAIVQTIYGCLAMTDFIDGDITTRLAECWLLLLPGLVAPDRLNHYRDLVEIARSTGVPAPDPACPATGS